MSSFKGENKGERSRWRSVIACANGSSRDLICMWKAREEKWLLIRLVWVRESLGETVPTRVTCALFSTRSSVVGDWRLVTKDYCGV